MLFPEICGMISEFMLNEKLFVFEAYLAMDWLAESYSKVTIEGNHKYSINNKLYKVTSYEFKIFKISTVYWETPYIFGTKEVNGIVKVGEFIKVCTIDGDYMEIDNLDSELKDMFDFAWQVINGISSRSCS